MQSNGTDDSLGEDIVDADKLIIKEMDRLVSHLKTLLDFTHGQTQQHIQQIQSLLKDSISGLNSTIHAIERDAMEKLQGVLTFLGSIVARSSTSRKLTYHRLAKVLISSRERIEADLTATQSEVNPTEVEILKRILFQIDTLLESLHMVEDSLLASVSSAQKMLEKQADKDSHTSVRQDLLRIIDEISLSLEDVKKNFLVKLVHLCQDVAIASRTLMNSVLKEHIGDMLVELERFSSYFDDHISQVLEIDERMRGNINKAVQAMQVEDIASQLLVKISESTESTVTFIEKIPSLENYESFDAYLAALKSYDAETEAYISGLTAQTSIQQENMDAGDEELF